jgi:hypothetical protein
MPKCRTVKKNYLNTKIAKCVLTLSLTSRNQKGKDIEYSGSLFPVLSLLHRSLPVIRNYCRTLPRRDVLIYTRLVFLFDFFIN